MPNTTELLRHFDQWLAWLQMCWGLPMSAPACRSLWMSIVYAMAAIGIGLVLWAGWKAIQRRLHYDAAIRAQMERERIAEPMIMEQHKFKEAGDVAADITDPHLAEKIRAELDRQRLEKMTGRTRAT